MTVHISIPLMTLDINIRFLDIGRTLQEVIIMFCMKQALVLSQPM